MSSNLRVKNIWRTPKDFSRTPGGTSTTALKHGWPDFLACWPNLKIIFQSEAEPFKFSSNFCKAKKSSF